MADEAILGPDDPRYADFMKHAEAAIADALAALDPYPAEQGPGGYQHPAAIGALANVIAALVHDFGFASTPKHQRDMVKSIAATINKRLDTIKAHQAKLN